MGMLDGKRFIIFGIASKRSIAWGIAEAMHREGATLAFTYQNDRLKDRVVDMAAACDSTLVFPRAMPNYNVMGLAKASLEANTRFMATSLGPDGIRVNAISAGPIKTLAAAGIGDFKKLLGHVSAVSPMRDNTTIEQVGNTAAFLSSPLASGITGQIIYVDGGFNIVSMPDLS